MDSSPNAARKDWMSTLAKADAARLLEAWETVPPAARPDYELLRPAEIGLVMVRGRTGGTGDRFNLGEMTVTRCAVRLANGETGLSWRSGRDKRAAEVAAVLDGMLQSSEMRAPAEALVAGLADEQSGRREAQRARAAPRSPVLHHDADAGRQGVSEAIDLGAVRRGFQRPALEAQRIYRRLLDAIARPGRIQDLSEAPEPPAGFTRAMAGIALTLLDFETKVWLDPRLRGGEAEAWLRFHCNCPFVEDPKAAAFALVVDAAAMPRLDAFDEGDARYPDRSTTIIVQIPALTGGETVSLEGPGIDGEIAVAPSGLPADIWQQVADNGREFQLGVDLMVVDDENVLGLPRTVRVAGARATD